MPLCLFLWRHYTPQSARLSTVLREVFKNFFEKGTVRRNKIKDISAESGKGKNFLLSFAEKQERCRFFLFYQDFTSFSYGFSPPVLRFLDRAKKRVYPVLWRALYLPHYDKSAFFAGRTADTPGCRAPRAGGYQPRRLDRQYRRNRTRKHGDEILKEK